MIIINNDNNGRNRRCTLRPHIRWAQQTRGATIINNNNDNDNNDDKIIERIIMRRPPNAGARRPPRVGVPREAVKLPPPPSRVPACIFSIQWGYCVCVCDTNSRATPHFYARTQARRPAGREKGRKAGGQAGSSDAEHSRSA